MILRKEELLSSLRRIEGHLSANGKKRDALCVAETATLIEHEEIPDQLTQTSKLTSDRLIDFIIQSGMVSAPSEAPGVIVWSANCHEQLEAFIREFQ